MGGSNLFVGIAARLALCFHLDVRPENGVRTATVTVLWESNLLPGSGRGKKREKARPH